MFNEPWSSLLYEVVLVVFILAVLLLLTRKMHFLYLTFSIFSENKTETICCSGLCVDLLNKLEDELGFTYDLVRTPDPKWGTFEVST